MQATQASGSAHLAAGLCCSLALKMEAVCSLICQWTCAGLHGVTFQKIILFTVFMIFSSYSFVPRSLFWKLWERRKADLSHCACRILCCITGKSTHEGKKDLKWQFFFFMLISFPIPPSCKQQTVYPEEVAELSVTIKFGHFFHLCYY
jgi:hypothetical protein